MQAVNSSEKRVPLGVSAHLVPVSTMQRLAETPLEFLEEVEGAIYAHRAVLSTVARLIGFHAEMEVGFEQEELYDLEATITQAGLTLQDNVDLWYAGRREALGLSHEPAVPAKENEPDSADGGDQPSEAATGPDLECPDA